LELNLEGRIPTPSSDWNNKDCLLLIASENKLSYDFLHKNGISKTLVYERRICCYINKFFTGKNSASFHDMLLEVMVA
jgi:hypothetical protein